MAPESAARRAARVLVPARALRGALAALEALRRLDRRLRERPLSLPCLISITVSTRVEVVEPLLLALRGDARLRRPVVELHLRDAGDLADLAEGELELARWRMTSTGSSRSSGRRALYGRAHSSRARARRRARARFWARAPARARRRLSAVGSPATVLAVLGLVLLDSTTGASVETRSPSRRRMTITPCVARPRA